jgi:hypothetical protein
MSTYRLCFFQDTEYTVNMANLKSLAVFLVCSVSFFSPWVAPAATASNYSSFSSSSAPSYQQASVQTVRMTRSSRETQNSASISSSRGPLSPGSHNLALGVGQIFLMADVADIEFENAIGADLHYTYGVSDLFSFEANFGYSSHSSGGLTMWRIAPGVRTNLVYFDQLIPFASLGLGFYNPSATLANGSTLSGLLFGVQLGAGVELLLSDRFFFGSRLTFHNMFESSKKDSGGTARSLGGSFLAFLVHAGITF